MEAGWAKGWVAVGWARDWVAVGGAWGWVAVGGAEGWGAVGWGWGWGGGGWGAPASLMLGPGRGGRIKMGSSTVTRCSQEGQTLSN